MNGIVGKRWATYATFAYSAGLVAGRESGRLWDEAALDAWIEKPRAVVPDTKMTFPGLAVLVIGLALVAGVSYAAGFASSRSQGEISAYTIAAATAAGPGAASAWASLMADNDPVQALPAGKKSAATDANGRRYCSLPVWLDPSTKAVPGQ